MALVTGLPNSYGVCVSNYQRAYGRFSPWLSLFGVIALAAMTGCGSSPTAAPISANPTFVLTEFEVKLDRPTIPHGTVTLVAKNIGAEEHELVLVRAAAVADLPTKADGSIDEDKIAESDKVGEIAHVQSKHTMSASFELTAGTYVAFCNLVDTMGNTGSAAMGSGRMGSGNMGSGNMASRWMSHVHFSEGMHQVITVT